MTMPIRATVFLGAIAAVVAAASADPWPAEYWSQSTNLTAVEGPRVNDCYQDLSGAFWNPFTRRLWLCRNGPSDSTSKHWSLREDGAGSLVVDTPSGSPAEWTGFGDFEAVTQVDLDQSTIYALIEGEEVVKRYSVGIPGFQTLQRTWNTSPHLPLDGGLGAEGLAFVPDVYLRAAGFTDASGLPCTSIRGMGGLMFIGHQNGGRVYAFDLDPNSAGCADQRGSELVK